MHHRDTPSQPGNDADRSPSSIPAPRDPLDDNIENLPKTGPDQPVWWYDQSREHGGYRRFSGHVIQVRGTEAERLRGELADVIGDLLHWARTQQHDEDGPEQGRVA